MCEWTDALSEIGNSLHTIVVHTASIEGGSYTRHIPPLWQRLIQDYQLLVLQEGEVGHVPVLLPIRGHVSTYTADSDQRIPLHRHQQ